MHSTVALLTFAIQVLLTLVVGFLLCSGLIILNFRKLGRLPSKHKKVEISDKKKDLNEKVALVLVLGDLNRSPRIQYQALQLAKQKSIVHVHLAGYVSQDYKANDKKSRLDTLLPELQNNYKISIIPLKSAKRIARNISKLDYMFQIITRILNQLFSIIYDIVENAPDCDIILVQTPPAIPTLPIAQFLTHIVYSNAKLIIDWHNLAYTLMGLNAPKLTIDAAKSIEKWFGKYAHLHLTVSNAMSTFLKTELNLTALSYDIVEKKDVIVTLYDHSPSFFKELSIEDKNKFIKDRLRLSTWNDVCKQSIYNLDIEEKNDNDEDFKIIVSSTSWTEDEDFNILLNALIQYDETVSSYKDEDCKNNSVQTTDINDYIQSILKTSNKNGSVFELPNRGLYKLAVIITGKGPDKVKYENKIKELKLKSVRIITKWLESNEYPLLLGSVDFGLSLHKSSSGIDLPMKIIDMFGCCLPVLSIDYKCLREELVENGKNGLLFTDSHDLYILLILIFNKDYDIEVLIKYFKNNIKLKNQSGDWNKIWLNKFKSII